jgi:hypothetical protein
VLEASPADHGGWDCGKNLESGARFGLNVSAARLLSREYQTALICQIDHHRMTSTITTLLLHGCAFTIFTDTRIPGP